jgi:probable F420-dependent oxidoreductase
MALKDKIPLGMSLPHRSPDPLDGAAAMRVARRAEALGFRDLWVTENTLDHVFSFDPVVALSFAAAATTTIRVGVAVVVLPHHNPVHVAHQVATLDQLSGGRAILGVGLGRAQHYPRFQVPEAHRVGRFREAVELIKALWTEPVVDHPGSAFPVAGATMPLKPVQRPHPPLWFGGGHPDALRRAAELADGWMGAGGSSTAEFARAVPLLRHALAPQGRDPQRFPISKRVFMAVDERPEAARAQVERWYTEVYHNPAGTDASGIHGTPEVVRERLEELVAMGANHLLLNPVARYEEQVEAVAEAAGLT